MDFIIYHQNCPDGWAAAFIAKSKYPEAELLPLNHGLNEAQITELFWKLQHTNVLMLDYSLRTRELNDRLYDITKTFRILDHHKTAQAVLEGEPYATFDMKRSGVGLAWDYLFGKDSGYNPADPAMIHRPWWVNYTEDQDLWNWLLPHSQEINAFLMVQERTVERWKEIIQMSPAEAERAGKGVRSYIEYYTRSVVADAQEGVLVFEGRNLKTAVLNIPYVGVSEAGSTVVKQGYDIALLWYERGDGIIQFSLRSNKEGSDIDVSAIAKFFGGGGHRNAAGFQVSIERGRDLVDKVLARRDFRSPGGCV